MTSVKARPCRACFSPVYDLEHVRTRRSAPINVAPDPKGNILVHVEEGFYTVVRDLTLVAMTEEERQKLHTNHFMTCRYRDRFRKNKEVNSANRAGGGAVRSLD